MVLPMLLSQAISRLLSCLCSWRSLARAILSLALIGHATVSFAVDEVKVSPAQIQSLGVRVTHPVSSRTDQTLPYPAQIVIPTPQLWVVSAPVAGMVTSLSVARGDRVTPGQRLVTLQSPSFVSLQRDYLHAAAQDVLATQQLDGTPNCSKARRYRNAWWRRARPRPGRPALRWPNGGRCFGSAACRMRISPASPTKLRSRRHLSVAAPEPATVVEIAVSPGQRVEQSAPLVKLARLSPLWAEIAIPASSIRAIRPGAKVEVDGYATPGQVVLVSETTDAATQTVLVRAELPNNGELRPGQTAAVRISFLSAGESAWEVPYSAVVRRGEAASIFVAIEGGFRLIPVTLLAEDQDHVVVAGKVTDKNEVAVSGISALRGILLRLGAGN